MKNVSAESVLSASCHVFGNLIGTDFFTWSKINGTLEKMQTAMAAGIGIFRILYHLHFDRQPAFESGIPFGQNAVLHPVPAGHTA